MNFLWFNGSFYWKKFLWLSFTCISFISIMLQTKYGHCGDFVTLWLLTGRRSVWITSVCIPSVPSTFLPLCFSVWKELSSVSTTNTAAPLSHHLHQHTQTAGIIQNRHDGPLGFLWFENLVRNVHKINKGDKDLSDVMRGILYLLPQLPF